MSNVGAFWVFLGDIPLLTDRISSFCGSRLCCCLLVLFSLTCFISHFIFLTPFYKSFYTQPIFSFPLCVPSLGLQLSHGVLFWLPKLIALSATHLCPVLSVIYSLSCPNHQFLCLLFLYFEWIVSLLWSQNSPNPSGHDSQSVLLPIQISPISIEHLSNSP